HPDAEIVGCGGPLMQAEGLESILAVDKLSVMGVADLAGAILFALVAARDLGALADETRPDVAVLIDAWGFSQLAAPRIRAAAPGVAMVKVAAPQVWANRPKRAHDAVALFDEILCLLPFEPPLFTDLGGKASFIGNPTFKTAMAAVDRADNNAFKDRYNLSDAPTLLAMLGSRRSEVSRLAEPFGDAAARLASHVDGLNVISVVAPSVKAQAEEALSAWSVPVTTIPAADKYAAFAAADIALAASGTVTTELTIFGVPTVVGYRVDRLSELWARMAVICDYASIVNIAANRSLLPEFLQDDCTGEALFEALRPFVDDDQKRREWASEATEIVQSLVPAGLDPANAAAARILSYISRH
ncbi:MAG: hypothetical protein AAF668_12100, partial [Pseudomonadota bacterium]